MSTPGTPIAPAAARSGDAPDRHALRLRLGRTTGVDRLDGGWWPQSRDLEAELADLVDHFPTDRPRVVAALVSPLDWDATVPRVRVADGHVDVGPLGGDHRHVVELTMSDESVLHLLVIPADFSAPQGAEALLAAATAGNAHSAEALLAVVSEHPDIDPDDRWVDQGDSWWGTDGAPSFRVDDGDRG